MHKLLRLKAAKYEIQKPSTCRATLFRCKFWVDVSRFSPCIINLSRKNNICCGLKKCSALIGWFSWCGSNMVAFLAWQVVSLMKNEQQSQNLLLKVDQRSAFRNTFPQPATNVFVAGQVDRARWKTGTCNETMLRDKLRVFVSRISPPLFISAWLPGLSCQNYTCDFSRESYCHLARILPCLSHSRFLYSNEIYPWKSERKRSKVPIHK